MTQFEVGKTYATRSIGDYDCIFSCEILARTAKTVTIKVTHERDTKRCGIKLREDSGGVWVESFRPFGTYSMCATIYATERAMQLAEGQDVRA